MSTRLAITSTTLALLAGGNAFAEVLTFAADDGVVIVRSYDQFDHAIVEFIGEAGALYQCVAMGPSGTPIATASAMADLGQIILPGIEASTVAAVACRKVR